MERRARRLTDGKEAVADVDLAIMPIDGLRVCPCVDFGQRSRGSVGIRSMGCVRGYTGEARDLRFSRRKVEVELKDIALRLVAAGIGDTYLPSAFIHLPYSPAASTPAPSPPPSNDTLAIITRSGARISTGVRGTAPTP
jgi:hypothetical protein